MTCADIDVWSQSPRCAELCVPETLVHAACQQGRCCRPAAQSCEIHPGRNSNSNQAPRRLGSHPSAGGVLAKLLAGSTEARAADGGVSTSRPWAMVPALLRTLCGLAQAMNMLRNVPTCIHTVRTAQCRCCGRVRTCSHHTRVRSVVFTLASLEQRRRAVFLAADAALRCRKHLEMCCCASSSGVHRRSHRACGMARR